jgi:hypothetical protein
LPIETRVPSPALTKLLVTRKKVLGTALCETKHLRLQIVDCCCNEMFVQKATEPLHKKLIRDVETVLLIKSGRGAQAPEIIQKHFSPHSIATAAALISLDTSQRAAWNHGKGFA